LPLIQYVPEALFLASKATRTWRWPLTSN